MWTRDHKCLTRTIPKTSKGFSVENLLVAVTVMVKAPKGNERQNTHSNLLNCDSNGSKIILNILPMSYDICNTSINIYYINIYLRVLKITWNVYFPSENPVESLTTYLYLLRISTATHLGSRLLADSYNIHEASQVIGHYNIRQAARPGIKDQVI